MVSIRKGIVAFSLLALSCVHTPAQGATQVQDQELDLKDALAELLSNALQITISARVLPSDEKPVWNVDTTKLTIPGRSVKVRLDGDNVRIYLVVTPYNQENGDILLLAQGQVWLTEPPEKEVKYFSTFYSIPVSYGEKILFFPLGLSEEMVQKQQKESFNIEMEIQIVPYNKEKK